MGNLNLIYPPLLVLLLTSPIVAELDGFNSALDEIASKEKNEARGHIIQIYFVEAPDRVKTGESFNVTISLRNNFDAFKEIEVYSYVFEGRKCLSFGGWKGNAQRISLNPGEGVNVVLENFLKGDAESGNYTMRARAKGEKDYDVSKEIEVIQQPFDIERQRITGQMVLNNDSDSPEFFLFAASVAGLIVLFLMYPLKRGRFL